MIGPLQQVFGSGTHGSCGTHWSDEPAPGLPSVPVPDGQLMGVSVVPPGQ